MNIYHIILVILLPCSLFTMDRPLQQPMPIFDFTNPKSTSQTPTLSFVMHFPNNANIPIMATANTLGQQIAQRNK